MDPIWNLGESKVKLGREASRSGVAQPVEGSLLVGLWKVLRNMWLFIYALLFSFHFINTQTLRICQTFKCLTLIFLGQYAILTL